MRWKTLPVLAIAILGLAACGSDDDATSEGADTTAADAPSGNGDQRFPDVIEAEVEAFAIAGHPAHARRATRAFEWFLGANHLGIPVYEVHVTRLAGMSESLRRLGELAGTSRSADLAADALDADIGALEEVGRRICSSGMPVVLRSVGTESSSRVTNGWLSVPNTISVSPIETRSLLYNRVRAVIRLPLTKVPFWLPRSTTRQLSSAGSMRQWFRDARASRSARWLSFPRPTVTGSSRNRAKCWW